MSNGPVTLDRIESAIILALSNRDLSLQDLSNLSGLNIDQTRRGVERLKYKSLISVNEQIINSITLGSEGKKAVSAGLPERRLVNAVIAGSQSIQDAVARGFIKPDEVAAAVPNAKKNGWVEIVAGGKLSLKNEEYKTQSSEEIALLRISEGTNVERLDQHVLSGLERLKKRPDYIEVMENKKVTLSLTDAGRALVSQAKDQSGTASNLTPELLATGKWKEIRLSRIDVNAPVPAVYPGRSHPLSDIISEIKEIFVGLGFEEISGPFIQSAFWNFDALYTPQDHPAREMQDTFYLRSTKKPIPATKQQIAQVSQVHRRGWGSDWQAAEGERLVLRTHTTPVTLQQLAKDKPDSARYFSVGRVFRNEKVSYKHLVEFHQVEGVATHAKASLRDIIGLQTEFYRKMGITKIKFWPTFFPYTEPSLQSMVYNDNLGKWVELFGMGIFRPEVTRPLGIKNPVLAWGGGLERIAMLRFSLDDVRELYKSRISWLRNVPKCQL